MSSLFSSPGKQAQQAAAASGAMSQGEIAQLQQYDTQQRQGLRDAISGMGQNPYFAAAAEMNPGSYSINPADTTTFGSQGPGTQSQAVMPAAAAVPYGTLSQTPKSPAPILPPPSTPAPPPPGAPPSNAPPQHGPQPIEHGGPINQPPMGIRPIQPIRQ